MGVFWFEAEHMEGATTPPSVVYQQQQPGETLGNPEAGQSSNGWHSSGSIGPFFAVISVLTVLAIISCVVGRICTRRERESNPLENVNKKRDCFRWVKRNWQKRCDVEVGSKIMADSGNDSKLKDGDVQQIA